MLALARSQTDGEPVMNSLITVLALLANGLCTWLGFLAMRNCTNHASVAYQSALRAEASEVRLKVARADVLALQAHVGTLETQLQRLQGRVYAQPRRARDDIAGGLMDSEDPRARAVGAAHAAMGVGIAVPSPRTCNCGYCETCLNGPTKEIAS